MSRRFVLAAVVLAALATPARAQNFLLNTNFGLNPSTLTVISQVESRGGLAFVRFQSLWGTIRLSITHEAGSARIHWQREPANLPFRLQVRTNNAGSWQDWVIEDLSTGSTLIPIQPNAQPKMFRTIIGPD